MSDMKDFRRLADEAMSDIFATEEMKNKVISRSKGRSRLPAGRLVGLAACGVLILGVLDLSGALRLQNQQGDQRSQMNIFSAANTAAPNVESHSGPSDTVRAEHSGSGVENQPGTAAEWRPADFAEAGASFGPEFLIPAYMPKGYKLGQITAFGTDTKAAEKIIMTYNAGKQTFIITEQKEDGNKDVQGLFKDYQKVKIGGSDGYVKTAADENTGSDSAVMEVHWFKSNVHYSITGDLTREDALMTAQLMLPPGQ
ncbi:MAG TPA: DUF4367 domain-containing protein [Clostridia bacterium]|nr:DUF4367 domain-containing protein [Clostridia bacterium]